MVYDVRRQVERVNALFPGEALRSFDARNEIIGSWDDEGKRIDAFLREVDDTLTPLLADLEQKLDSFIRRCGLAK